MKPTRLAIAGCGVVATAYYLPWLLEQADAEITAVCDLDGRRVDACKRLFGAKHGYTDYFAMLEAAAGARDREGHDADEVFDAVLILTAPGTHVAFSLAAIERGFHLLVQKPMALNLADADRIAQAVRAGRAADGSPIKALIEPSDHTVLDPDYAHLRDIVDRGVLGDPYWFSLVGTAGTDYSNMLGGNPYGNAAFYSKDSGGALFDFPYAPCQIVTLLGDCTTVNGNARCSVPERKIVPEGDYTGFLEACTDPHDCNYWDQVLGMEKTEPITAGAPDNVFSTYELADGWVGTFHVGRPFHPVTPGSGGNGGLQIFGSRGNVIFGGSVDGQANFASIITDRYDLLPEAERDSGPPEPGKPFWYHIPLRGDFAKASWPKPVPGAFNYYAESTRHLIDCIRDDRDPLLNVEFGRHITEMMHGALESERTACRYRMTTTTGWATR